jgi:cell shape-determining protein MreC
LVTIYSVPIDERQSFYESVNQAQLYRDQHEPEQRKAKLRESFAVREEVESLTQSVDELRKILAGLTKAQSENPAAAAGKEALPKRKAPLAKD